MKCRMLSWKLHSNSFKSWKQPYHVNWTFIFSYELSQRMCIIRIWRNSRSEDERCPLCAGWGYELNCYVFFFTLWILYFLVLQFHRRDKQVFGRQAVNVYSELTLNSFLKLTVKRNLKITVIWLVEENRAVLYSWLSNILINICFNLLWTLKLAAMQSRASHTNWPRMLPMR